MTGGQHSVKRCVQCEVEKAKSLFPRRRREPDGRADSCLQCAPQALRGRIPNAVEGELLTAPAGRLPDPTITDPVPYRRLLASVIMAAVEDFLAKPLHIGVCRDDLKRAETKPKRKWISSRLSSQVKRENDRRSAVAFLFDECGSVFQWMADCIDIDVDSARERLLLRRKSEWTQMQIDFVEKYRPNSDAMWRAR